MTARSSGLSAPPGASCARQVLTFSLGSQGYGVDILRVQEIRGWTPVTRIPELPPHVLGVLNLRGSIVPIIDLRLRFNLAHAELIPLTVIIVLSIGTSSGPREFGLVVDGVSDVVDIHTVKQTPSLGNGVAVDIIEGLAIVDGRMLIMLNVEELIRRDTEQVSPAALAS
jgi:purine-binding chemotaxis protein CheW